MSKTNLSDKNKFILIAEAAGVCEFPGCGKHLFEDQITKDGDVFSQFAHIIGDSPNGPRGDIVLSEKYKADRKNIMLLCPDCHKRIDSHPNDYPVELLIKMKKEHETRMKIITSVKNVIPSTVLIYTANIGIASCLIDNDEVNDVIMPKHYPADRNAVSIGMKHAGKTEKTVKYWKDEVENLEYEFDRKIRQPIEHGDIKHLSVFALAPQPLLVKLGAMITDIIDTDVYQLHREPKSWEWQEGTSGIFRVHTPTYFGNAGKKPVLVFSLSSNITERVKSYYKQDDISLWEVTIDNPNNDFLRSREQLIEFRIIMRMVMEDINKHSAEGPVDVYMAMPIACAVEFGRIRMPKADRHLILHDYLVDGNKDESVLTI